MKQITIVTETKAGLVAEISEVLGSPGININSLVAPDTPGHYGVVVLTVDRYDEALVALRDASYPAVTEDGIVVRIPDDPGALAKLSRRFYDANIGLRSARIIRRDRNGFGLAALCTECTEKAPDLVRDVLIS